MPSFVEIGPVVLKKNIIKLGKCISTILILSLFGKGHCSSVEQTWIPFTQGWMQFAKFDWNWPSKWKCEKFMTTMTTTTTTTDNRETFIRKAHLSLRLRWAKKNIKEHIRLCKSQTKLNIGTPIWFVCKSCSITCIAHSLSAIY